MAMAEKKTTNKTSGDTETREERLKAALKANLQRRKAQSRGRAQLAQAQDRQEDTKPGGSGQNKDA